MNEKTISTKKGGAIANADETRDFKQGVNTNRRNYISNISDSRISSGISNISDSKAGSSISKGLSTETGFLNKSTLSDSTADSQKHGTGFQKIEYQRMPEIPPHSSKSDNSLKIHKNTLNPTIFIVIALIIIGVIVIVFFVKHKGDKTYSDYNMVNGDNDSIFTDDGDYDSTTDDSDYDSTTDETKNVRSFSVTAVKRKTMHIDGIFIGETISINEEPTVSFSGFVSEENQESVFSFTAPTSGMYMVSLKDINANTSVRLIVRSSNGDNVFDTISGGSSAILNSGETYEIIVRYRYGSSSYLVVVGVPKPATDISSATTINDQVSFIDQNNIYFFTAPENGTYRFDLTETNASNRFRLIVLDHLDNNILDTISGGGCVVLNGNETYKIQVRQKTGLGSYRMIVGFQKPTKDITNYDVVFDSVEYIDQVNYYLFTAPISGGYRFDLTEVNANNRFRLMMWDHLDNNILDTISGGGYVVLNGNETYKIQVRQKTGLGSYKMIIGYQHALVDISDYDTINDSIEFADQKNVYDYTPSYSGQYTVNLKNYSSSCSIRLVMYDDLDNNIFDTRSGQGEANLESGKTYKLQVIQYKGYSDYQLSIEMTYS